MVLWKKSPRIWRDLVAQIVGKTIKNSRREFMIAKIDFYTFARFVFLLFSDLLRTIKSKLIHLRVLLWYLCFKNILSSILKKFTSMQVSICETHEISFTNRKYDSIRKNEYFPGSWDFDVLSIFELTVFYSRCSDKTVKLKLALRHPKARQCISMRALWDELFSVLPHPDL